MLQRAGREAALGVLVVALVVAVGWRAPVFWSAASVDTSLSDGAILTIMALAQMLALLIRRVDLSVGANMALSGMLSALLSRAQPELPVALSIAVALAAGLGLGLLNGLCIAWLELPAIVVTLGTMSMFRGLVFVVSGGAWVNAHELGPIPFDPAASDEQLSALLADYYARRSLTRTAIHPDDCARAILFLAGPQARCTTGHLLPVDGGLVEAFLR